MEKTVGSEQKSKLLIVEDDESQLRTLTAIMEDEGSYCLLYIAPAPSLKSRLLQ